MNGTFYFLDFDGTLSPIVKDPGAASFPKKAKMLIEALARDKGSKVAIVTGRAYSDIFKRIGLGNIYYAANHGLEIYNGRKKLLIKGDRFKKGIGHLSDVIKKAISNTRGVIIQEKGLSLSLHFRMVPVGKRKALIRKVIKAIKVPLKETGLDMHGGKMVIEIRPRAEWNKGDAVKWLCKRYGKGLLPFYIGDDVTDEDAFKELKGKGISARIRYKKGTNATHILKSPLY